MSEPMVKVVAFRCPNCGRYAEETFREHVGTPSEIVHAYPFVVSAEWVRTRTAKTSTRCLLERGGCGQVVRPLFAIEPVPGCGPAYPATERDEDSADYYAREQALEDAR